MRIRASVAPFALTAAALLLGAPAPAAADELEWTDDFEAAKKRAGEEKKFILADFTGSDWCGWCIKLKKEVFDTPEFKAWADENVVLLELDFPRAKKLPERVKAQNDELQQKFGVRGFPTIIFMDPDGAEVGRSGYKAGGPGVWTGSADEILAKGRAYMTLKAKADRTLDEEVELLEAEIGMKKIGATAAKERLAGLDGITAEQKQRLQGALTDLEVLELLEQNPPRSPQDMIALGAKFAEMHAAGRQPKSDEAAGPFFVGLAEHAYAQKDADLLESAIEAIKARFGTGGGAKRFIDQQTARLNELRGGK